MSIETEFQSTIQNVQNAYNGLNNLGATIPQNKTIENIKSCLDEIYDRLPKTEYQEGTEITLSNTLKGKLDFEDGIVGYGQTEQDGTPTPNAEIPINSVTGNQDVVVSGKNLFEPVISVDGTQIIGNNMSNLGVTDGEFSFTANGADVYFGQVLASGSTYTANRGIKIYRNGNEKISYKISNTEINRNFITAYDSNGTSLGYVEKSGSSQGTYTFPNNCEFVTFRIGKGNAVSGTTYTFNVIVAYGDEIPPYEPYITPKSYQLSLGDKELYDECTIVGSPDNWKYVDNYYKEKFSNTTIERAVTSTSGKYRFKIVPTKQAKGTSTTSEVANIYSNIASKESANDTYGASNGIAIATTGNIFLYQDNFSAYTTAQMQEYFSSRDDYIVYPLATPIETPITDTTLISQLNAWYNAHSNNGTTIITSNGNLPMIIKVRGLKGE